MSLRDNIILGLEASGDGGYWLSYLGYKVGFKIYRCIGEKAGFGEEINRLDLPSNCPVAVIPLSMLSSAYQLIQGLAYYVGSEKLRLRIRNKGLLLAVLITGKRQLKDYILEASDSYSESDKIYYIVEIKRSYSWKPPSSCQAIRIEDLGIAIHPAVKNLKHLLDIIS